MSKFDKTKKERFVSAPMVLLNSPAFVALDAGAVKLFWDLRTKLNGYNNGNIDSTITTLKHRGWVSKSTLARALRQLLAAGIIAKTRETIGVQRGSKVCNLYRFTDMDCHANEKLSIPMAKASKDYERFSSLGHAVNAIKEASPSKPRNESEPKPPAKNKRSVQKLDRDGTETGPITGFDGAETGPITKVPSPKTGPSKTNPILDKPLRGVALSGCWAKTRFGKLRVQKLDTYIDIANPTHENSGSNAAEVLQ